MRGAYLRRLRTTRTVVEMRAGDPQLRVAVGARRDAAGVQPARRRSARCPAPGARAASSVRAPRMAGGRALVAADGDRVDQRAEEVGVRVVDVAADEGQAPAAAAQPVGIRRRNVRVICGPRTTCRWQPRADAPAGPHAPRQVTERMNAWCRPRLELHARGELGTCSARGLKASNRSARRARPRRRRAATMFSPASGSDGANAET